MTDASITMLLDVSTIEVFLIALAMFAAGGVTGLTGFGFALVSTATLAVVLDPQTAVVIAILPVLATNLELANELDRERLRHCVGQFWLFLLAAAIGTVLGMVLLRRIPAVLFTLVLGVLILVYVLFTQTLIPIRGVEQVSTRFVRQNTVVNAGVGFAGGAVFGASNIGVPVVAYLDSFGLDRSTFVGLLALILLGISTLRVGVAWGLGLYGSNSLLLLSAGAALPALLGTVSGQAIRHRLPDRYIGAGVLVLLTIIGIRLTVSGLRML